MFSSFYFSANKFFSEPTLRMPRGKPNCDVTSLGRVIAVCFSGSSSSQLMRRRSGLIVPSLEKAAASGGGR